MSGPPALGLSTLARWKTTCRNARPLKGTGFPDPSWTTFGTYLADHVPGAGEAQSVLVDRSDVLAVEIERPHLDVVELSQVRCK